MGTTLLLTATRTDIERIRHDQKMRQEISSELALGLRDSLTTTRDTRQQLACSRDPELAHQLADSIGPRSGAARPDHRQFPGRRPGCQHKFLSLSCQLLVLLGPGPSVAALCVLGTPYEYWAGTISRWQAASRIAGPAKAMIT